MSRFTPSFHRRARLTRLSVQKTAVSPITGKLTIYTKCQGIAACEYFEFPMNVLKAAYNDEFANQSPPIDASVESCKKIRGMTEDHLLVDMWVAAESPIAPAVAALIIFLIQLVAVTVAGVVMLSAASAFVEKIFPKMRFYSPDQKVFESQAAYVTYMTNVWNPAHGYSYTCMYCGQGFKTVEERNAHQNECPWKGGVPNGGGADWLMLITICVVALGAIIIVPKLLDILPTKKKG